jgi:membrane-associated protease RseP (regulator of RpoE activity)
LGVVVDTPETITPPGLPPRRPRGALVSEVQTNSAAEVAGIAVGDLIVGVDGRVITSVRDLTDQMSGYEPGDETRIQIVRDDQLVMADVMLAGPDGIALRRPESKVTQRSSTASPSIVSGLGAAIGGLFGGPADGGANTTAPRVPASKATENSPAISPDAVRNPLPETLPPPAPEKD